MDYIEIIQLIASILAGMAVCLPLVIKLIEYVKEAAKNKDYTKILRLVTKFCEEAELLFATGEERKKWVMNRVRDVAEIADYKIDMDVVAQFIDDIVAASKLINVPKREEK